MPRPRFQASPIIGGGKARQLPRCFQRLATPIRCRVTCWLSASRRIQPWCRPGTLLLVARDPIATVTVTQPPGRRGRPQSQWWRARPVEREQRLYADRYQPAGWHNDIEQTRHPSPFWTFRPLLHTPPRSTFRVWAACDQCNGDLEDGEPASDISMTIWPEGPPAIHRCPGSKVAHRPQGRRYIGHHAAQTRNVDRGGVWRSGRNVQNGDGCRVAQYHCASRQAGNGQRYNCCSRSTGRRSPPL